jgi:type IV pilus assembly protein PilY1
MSKKLHQNEWGKIMKIQKNRVNRSCYTNHFSYGATFVWAFTGTMLVAASVAQASDMQIYAVPTAGKKTIVMMLDTSGSMGVNSSSNAINADYSVCSDRTTVQTETGGSGSYTYSKTYCSVSYSTSSTSSYQRLKDICYNPNKNADGSYSTRTGALKCYDRMSRLQDGMFAFLNSDNPKLNEARVGLGHFSVDGSGRAGKVLVTAERLGAVGSSQRNLLKQEIASLTAAGGTPTAHAYAEAAAYLLGTSTRSEAEIQKDLYKEITTQVFDRYDCPANRPYFNAANNTCYQLNTGFSGSSQTAGYVCPPSGAPTFRNIGTSSSTTRQRCYLDGYINNSNSNYYRSAARGCLNSAYPYLNTSNNTCYQYQGFSGSTATPITITRPELTYYKCLAWRSTDFTNGVQYCGTGTTSHHTTTNTTYWQNLGNTKPAGFDGDGIDDTTSGVVYSYTLEKQLGPNADSGFDQSVAASKNGTNYVSPLPAEADRVSCDGQGVYILSDGEANNTSVSRAQTVISAALGSYGSGFACPTTGGLDTGATASWHCMGALAKKLFNGGEIQTVVNRITNPVNVPIQTAFVGFGKDFNSLTQTHVQQACKLSSRTQADRTGDDACSPNQGANAIASPGFGNGGFFTTQSAEGVTDSVIAFLDNLGKAPLEPLTTGAISVPADALSPSGLQPYGYLRALEPNPQSNNMIWAGNLKRYKVILTGANAGAFASENGTTLVYNSIGAFNTNTKDLWNSNEVYDGNSYNDGGIISLGGASSRVPMPILGQAQDLTKEPKQYAFKAKPNALRRLFTNITANGGVGLTSKDDAGDLLSIPSGDDNNELPTTAIPAYVLQKFNEQATLKDFPILTKQKLLNYLGFSVALDGSATSLPGNLTTQSAPHLAMGGSVHSFPVQLTYSGTLDAAGKLTGTREQSILYGTMDGGLHIIDSSTGEEQMVFVPSELLRNPIASKALVKGGSDDTAPVHGVDGAWIADAFYKSKNAINATDTSKIQARQMNVYGGLRMGGESYYGLDVLNPKKPKILFRIGSDQSNFSRMGQSWSKPVIANIRYGNEIRRVMIVGGGYDVRYESPTFALTGSDTAQGNAIYIVDAKTGERLWWASNTGANTNNSDMKHSIVSRVSAIDRNADGLIDHLYFGDLGGQIFRADLNNAAGTTTANFGKRVVRLANLATTTAGVNLTGGKNPRFYQAPTVTIHDQGATTFMLVGIASGNRSTPLDVYPLRGRDGMSPASALNDRLVNNVYGIIDRDFIKLDLITGTPTLSTENRNLSHLQKDPQLLTTNIIDKFVGTSSIKDGWYRSLSSNRNGVEKADNSFRIPGGMKSFEEPIALTGNLIVPVYDPQGTGIVQQDPCKPRVIGETDSQRFCLPYGVCINTDGTINTGRESGTGFKTKTENCPVGITECNDKILGGGIVGLAPVPIKESTASSPCPDFAISGNEKGNGVWNCIPTINPTRWYERWKK